MDRTLASTLASMDRSSLAVLKDDPARSAVYRAEHGGRSWVLKVYRHQSWWKKLLRVSPARREMRLAQKAARLPGPGVRVSEPVTVVNLPGREEGIVLPFVEGEAMHGMVRTCADRALRLKMAAAVGRHVRALLEAGYVNRDCKLSNLIADARCVEGNDVPVMIDPLGLKRRRSEAQVVRMWATLLRTTLREGPITVREGLTCLRAGMGDSGLARRIVGQMGKS